MSVAVLVKFKNEKYNYITPVSGTASIKETYAYFVGQWLDMGTYPAENMQQCIGIEIVKG